ncbi:hypothetical protein BZA05DRAFT_387253 [Tricharina praecox]|uniref:uncharacterized protein n=1 Tax=Tricharina praecox TaxID=43433 RepID=UPI00221FCCB4|nr:uncharacterized protein BZA05DRAFT_387253 [Tricharina praecox]KAI5857098.1 hypothetical protein BZA05DRAFT_387253 [Tricharina praecox]
MRSTAVFAFAILSAATQVAAQAKCSAQNIVDTCVKTYQPRLEKCAGNDWECYCQEARNVRTCYNNCPDTSDTSGIDSQVTAWCNAFSATLPTTTSAIVVPSGSGSSTATGSSTSGTSGAGAGSSIRASAASASASASADSAAGAVGVVKGMGLAVGLVVVAGAFL